MKKKILSLAFLSLTSLAYAQENGVRFIKDLSWSEIKVKAKSEHKSIFVDVFATWCAPCKTMDQTTYPSEKAGAFINEKFISVKVQGNQTKNDTEFVKSWYADVKQILKEYNVSGYPTLLFFSPDGKLVNRSIGWTNEEGLIEVAKKSLNPSEQFYARLEKYNKGKLSVDEKPGLANTARSIGDTESAQKIADDYIDNYLLNLKDKDLLNKENLLFIYAFLEDRNTRAFSYFIKNKDQVNGVLGYYQAEYAIMNLIERDAPIASSWLTTKPNWNLLEKEFTEKYGSLGKEAIYGLRMSYYSTVKDWVMYGVWYKKYLEIAFKHPRYDINALSWILFQNVTDVEVLNFACDVVMKYAMEEWYQNNVEAWDTYANLLHKAGRTNQAISWEEKALKMKKGQGDVKVYSDALEKMKKGIATWTTVQHN